MTSATTRPPADPAADAPFDAPADRLPRGFGRYWAGQSVSFVGSQVTIFAMPLVALLTLHSGSLQLGALTAAGLLPHCLAPFFAGPLVDSLPRRPLMLTVDLLRAGLLLTVPALYGAGLLSFPLLLACAFVISCLSVVFDVANFSFLPELVPAALLQQANGRMEASRSFAGFIGPGGAGLVVRGFGAPLALVVDAVSFLVSAFSLATVRAAAPAPRSRPAGGYAGAVREGFRFLAARPQLILLGLGSGGFNLFAGAAMSITAQFALQTLRLTTVSFGVVFAVGSLGGFVAGLIAHRVEARWGARRTLIGGLALGAVGELPLVLCAPERLWTVPQFAVGQFLIVFGVTFFVVTNAAIRQQAVPPELMGRVNASMRVLNGTSAPIGAILGGVLAAGSSTRTVLVVACIGQLVAMAAFAAFRRLLPESVGAARS